MKKVKRGSNGCGRDCDKKKKKKEEKDREKSGIEKKADGWIKFFLL